MPQQNYLCPDCGVVARTMSLSCSNCNAVIDPALCSLSMLDNIDQEELAETHIPSEGENDRNVAILSPANEPTNSESRYSWLSGAGAAMLSLLIPGLGQVCLGRSEHARWLFYGSFALLILSIPASAVLRIIAARDAFVIATSGRSVFRPEKWTTWQKRSIWGLYALGLLIRVSLILVIRQVIGNTQEYLASVDSVLRLMITAEICTIAPIVIAACDFSRRTRVPDAISCSTEDTAHLPQPVERRGAAQSFELDLSKPIKLSLPKSSDDH